jgi:hypothetical protein
MIRDPRVDPKGGDVLDGLNGGRSETRRVLSGGIGGSSVLYTRGRSADPTCKYTVSLRRLAEWRRWARKADVLHAADPPARPLGGGE